MKTFTVLVRPKDFDNALLRTIPAILKLTSTPNFQEDLRSPPHRDCAAMAKGDDTAIRMNQ